MRIAHVTATFPPYRSGTGHVCLYNARELARLGHDVSIVTAAAPGAPSLAASDGVTIHRLRPLVRMGNAPVLPGLLATLRGFDVIHLHYPFILGAEMVRLASLIYRSPLVVSFHNDLIGDGARAPIFALYQRVSAFLTVRSAACLCAVSQDHYQSSLLYRSVSGGGPPAIELPNGVDVDLFSPDGPSEWVRERYGIPRDAKLLLFVATLDRAHHFKGLGTLLQALQGLPPEVWLLVVGDGDMRESYQQQAREMGVEGRTVFAGSVAHDETPPLFRAADLTVLPSSPPESFGLVLIESMACGTPVVASNIPGVRTVVEPHGDGLLVEPDNPGALTKALRQLLRDDQHLISMGRRGRAKVELRYSWTRIGTHLEEIYHQVLHHGDARARSAARSQP